MERAGANIRARPLHGVDKLLIFVDMKPMDTSAAGPVGVFDSGYGGLTILADMRRRLPELDYIYLGDNARAPYGSRSFDIVYNFTKEAVIELFERGCRLVILACNTASAKALRTIQQRDLPLIDASRRVLGVIRPTAESLRSPGGHVGLFATPGTVASGSYEMEIEKLHPGYKVTARACPLWVPLVENGYGSSDGADWFVRNDVEALLAADPEVDTVILGCTHYPLLYDKIRAALPQHIDIVRQGPLVADSLADYLHRHPDMRGRITTEGTLQSLTTEQPERFAALASMFLGSAVTATRITL